MPLTPEEFNKLAHKEDLLNLVTKNELADAKNEILTAIDAISKNLTNIKDEQVANLGAHERFDDRISRLETRA